MMLGLPYRPVRLCVGAGVLACSLILAGCGTNIKGMLSKQGQTFWEAEQMVETADSRGSLELAAVLVAEEVKAERCQRIDAAVSERMQKDSLPFWEQLWSDLTQLVALIVPIPVVERCAEAHDDYYQALERLRESLQLELQRSERRQRLPVQVSRNHWPPEDQHRKGR